MLINVYFHWNTQQQLAGHGRYREKVKEMQHSCINSSQERTQTLLLNLCKLGCPMFLFYLQVNSVLRLKTYMH